ncbi:hypothetical protein [Catenovulum sediminis]|uniref:HEAT repeat domain-containing protein n=1 Tax=Catenovulum sediminis TaxID=1740262 RepID=A0ABV1RNP8_9ALTE
MGLVKTSDRQQVNTCTIEQPDPMTALDSEFVITRRAAAKSLRLQADSAPLLLKLLEQEPNQLVVEALFDSLLYLYQHTKHKSQIVEQVVTLLPELEAAKRNSAILFLSACPIEMTEHMPKLLASTNTDLQLYALDILRSMNHMDAPKWLAEMLPRELHVNVVISVLERIAECQQPDLLEQVECLCARYQHEPLVVFSAHMAIERLGGACE